MFRLLSSARETWMQRMRRGRVKLYYWLTFCPQSPMKNASDRDRDNWRNHFFICFEGLCKAEEKKKDKGRFLLISTPMNKHNDQVCIAEKDKDWPRIQPQWLARTDRKKNVFHCFPSSQNMLTTPLLNCLFGKKKKKTIS